MLLDNREAKQPRLSICRVGPVPDSDGPQTVSGEVIGAHYLPCDRLDAESFMRSRVMCWFTAGRA